MQGSSLAGLHRPRILYVAVVGALLLVALSGTLLFATSLGRLLPATPVAAAHLLLVAICLVAVSTAGSDRGRHR